MLTIRNPVEWGVDQLKHAAETLEAAGRAGRDMRGNLHSPAPAVARIGVADLEEVLASGLRDFAAFRSDVIFLCVLYPVAGLILVRLAFGYQMLPLLFPLASGFALVGPFAAVGLYEMSRRREAGMETGWADAFGVIRSPSFPAIVLLGLVLMAIFLLWLGAALKIYAWTLGPEFAGLSHGVHPRRVHDPRRLDTNRSGRRRRLSVCVAGADDQRCVVSSASRPRGGSRHGDYDIGARGRHKSRPDGAVGIDCRRRAGDRVAAVSTRFDYRHAGARPRHLASLSAGGAALTSAAPRHCARPQLQRLPRTDRQRCRRGGARS